jgi:hypothetical protein
MAAPRVSWRRAVLVATEALKITETDIRRTKKEGVKLDT